MISFLQNQFWKQTSLWLVCWLGCVVSLSAATLNIGELESTGPTTGTVPVEFRSAGEVSAIQMDVLFDSSTYTASAAIQGNLADTYRVDSRLIEPGKMRVIVGAPSNAPLADSIAFRIPLTATSTFSTYFPIVLTNFKLSTSQSASVGAVIAPSVRFSGLTSGGSLNGINGIVLAADAAASGGEISRVDFYEGSTKLGSSSLTPFSLTWNPSAPGSFILQAIAFDSNGQQTSSRTVPITVYFNSPPTTQAVTLTATRNRTKVIPFSTLLAAASDPDANTLSLTEIDAATIQGGSLPQVASSLNYTPPTNFLGIDSFTYTLSDGLDGEADGVVNIRVTRLLQTDFNLDEKADLVIASGGKSKILQLFDGVLIGTKTGPAIPSGQQLVAVDDFDNDGKPDVVFYNPKTRKTQIRFLNGTSTKSIKNGPTITSGYEIVAADDFDQDGDTDFLLLNSKTQKTIIWYLKKGNFVRAKNGPTLTKGWSVAGTDDFNHDGNPDFCITDSKKAKIAIWFLNNNTIISKQDGPTVSSGYTVVGITDFDHDGKPDLLFYNPKNRKTSIYLLDRVSVTKKITGPSLPTSYYPTAPK